MSIENNVVSVDVNVSDPNVRVDIFIVVDGVNHVPLGLLSDTVVAGKTNVDHNSTVRISLNGSRVSSIGDTGQLVMVVRNSGNPELIAASDRPLYDGFQLAPPSSVESSLFEPNTWIVWLVMLGGVAALLPALQHTFPVLWERSKSNEEE